MGDFTTLADTLEATFARYWPDAQAQTLQQLRAYLQNTTANPVVRIWVDRGADPAIQSTSIAILRQLAGPEADKGFGYTGQIEVVYDPGPADDPTLPKVQSLLMELRGGTTGTVSGATVTLVRWTGQAFSQVNLGFTGAGPAGTDYAKRLNAWFLLQLAPYLSDMPNLVQRPDEPLALDLTDPRLPGTATLAQRAYFQATPIPKPSPADIAASPDKGACQMLETIVGLQLQAWSVGLIDQNVESGATKAPNSMADRLFCVITAALETQRDLNGNLRPGAENVMLACPGFFTSAEDQEAIRSLINGGMTPQEQNFKVALDQADSLTDAERASYTAGLAGWLARTELLAAIDAPNRVEFVLDATSLDAAVQRGQGHQDRVVLVCFGAVPDQMVQWAMDQPNGVPLEFPMTVSRTDHVSTMINTGLPYLEIADVGSRGAQYPAELVTPPVPQGETMWPLMDMLRGLTSQSLTTVTDLLSLPLWQWNPVPAHDPAAQVSDLVLEYKTERSDGALHTYFRNVTDLYREGLDDKLRLGLAALWYLKTGAESGQPVLQQLYEQIKAHVDGTGTLPLVPAIYGPDTGIGAFYLAFDGGLTLFGNVTYQANNPLTRIEVNGSTELGGVPMTATIVFTAPHNIVIADATYTASQPWSVNEVKWIVFGQPQIILTTPNAALPPAAGIGGPTVPPSPAPGTATAAPEEGKAAIAVRLPAIVGKQLLSYTFGIPQLDLDDFFTLIGGVDAIRALPAPFNGLGGFGVRGVQLSVDTSTLSVDCAGILLGTDANVSILGGAVVLSKIVAGVTLQRPADLAKRTTDWVVRATFNIGGGTVLVTANGPGLVLRGALTGGVIAFADLVNMFAPGYGQGLPGMPTVTAFAANLTPASGDYEVSCDLNLGWQFSIAGTVLFTIDALTFAATSVSGLVSGQLGGTVAIAGTIPLQLSARYDPVAQWRFEAAQPADAAYPLTALIRQFTGWDIDTEDDYAIGGVRLSVAANQGDWAASGHTVGETWVVPFLGATVTGNFRAGRSTAAGAYGRLEATFNWQNVSIVAYYDYNQSANVFGVRWGGLEGVITGPADGLYTATLRLSSTTTLGSLVETMVGWATGSPFALEAPWSLLNSVQLPAVNLVYTFVPGTGTGANAAGSVSVSVDIGPIDLGFARIDSAGLIYNPDAAQKVAITLTGLFPWNADGSSGDTGTLGPWDTSKPGTTPAPPGLGNKYVDVRLLTLGQHVTIAGLSQTTSVPDAISLMSQMVPPEAETIPTVDFDPAIGWIIGADLGFVRFGEEGAADSGYLVTAQAIFNDPLLYALRIALAGEKAKVFAGLDFQIMYRQVSDTAGVYQAELALPDAMRHLTIGGYSVTLPVVAVAVYTNGDFQVDVGFPWGGDFGRSFTIEAVIAPGVPVVGSAGFYFGRLSSATTDRVPQALNGTFNPVLVFGFGMQLGLGKQVEYGPLKAGFSLTAAGIIEGILATWNPYQPAIGSGSAVQVQDDYYFWLRGTFGLAGRLYGSVDFSVIKAEVDLSFTLMVQITYEAYTSMSVTVIVAVDVSVTVRIDVGLFSIRLSFSFSMRIRETLTIDNGGNPPWRLDSGAQLLRVRAALRHGRLRSPGLTAGDPVDRWYHLTAPDGPHDLFGWVVPATTAARDENNPGQQDVCQIFLAFLDNVPDGADPNLDDTSFERLAKMLLRWVVSALQDADVSPADVDEMTVTEADLTGALQELLRSTSQNPTPIDAAAIDAFLSLHYRYHIKPPPDSEQVVDAALFPMPPGLILNIPAYGSGGRTSYPLSGYNSIGQEGLAYLRAYFDELAVQVSAETPAGQQAADATAMSMAQWVQADYFLLVARQMSQLALDALRTYRYRLVNGETVSQILANINDAAGLDGADAVTATDLFSANAVHPLTTGTSLVIAPSVKVTADASFDSISAGLTVSATALAVTNAATEDILASDVTIVYPGTGKQYTTSSSSTLVQAARGLGVAYGEFLGKATVGGFGLLATTGLLRLGADLPVPYATYTAATYTDVTDGGATPKPPSFENVAKLPAYSSSGIPFTAEKLAMRNAGAAILRAGEIITYSDTKYTVRPGDTLADIAMYVGAPDLPTLYARSGLLSQIRLIAEVAVLTLPQLTFVTRTDDTLAGISTTMAISVEATAITPVNLDTKNLFAIGKDDLAWLDIPHLPQFSVGGLLDVIKDTGGLHQLSHLVSRYGLHGTRLPTKDINPNHPGIWVTSAAAGLHLPDMAGLYALTGQQFIVPAQTEADFSVQVVEDTTASNWFVIDTSDHTLTFTMNKGTRDGQRITAIYTTLNKGAFNIPVRTLGAGLMSSAQPASYPLTTLTEWLSPTPVRLPYGKPPTGNQVPALRIWTLPSGMSALPQPGKVAPRFAINLASYDEASGATVTTPVSGHGWASVVSFTVRRVPVQLLSLATATTYEIVGAGGADAVVLERMVAQVTADSTYDKLIIGFDAASGTGVQTADPDMVTLGIAQVNLSTVTNPDSLAVDAAVPGLLNTATEFVRLLWEAGITRSGGFYLYYFDTASLAGLPDRIFDDKGLATIRLIALYRNPGDPAAGDRLTNYMTAAVTSDPFETASAVVTADAAPDEAPVQATGTLTLADLAARTYSDLGQLADANRALSLTPACGISVRHGLYQIPPGQTMTFEQIAGQFPMTTAQAIAGANPAWPPATVLRYPQAIYLPPLTVVADSSPSSGTLEAIAWYYGTNLTALAADNAGVAGLFKTGSQVKVTGGPIVRTATVPPGVALAEATRTPAKEPPPDPAAPEYGARVLEQNFSMLTYQVAENPYFNESILGLPAGPDGADEWRYRQSVPYPRFSRAASAQPAAPVPMPDPQASPYRGIGTMLQINFAWQDAYGNQLHTTLDDGTGNARNQPPLLAGYTDAVLGLGQWPSVSSSWTAQSGPALAVTLGFDPSRYLGPVAAQRTSATVIGLQFLDLLDSGSASVPGNYTVSGRTVVSVSVSYESVKLSLDTALTDGEYSITVNGVRSTAGYAENGSVLLTVAGSGSSSGPATGVEAALRDLEVYTSLYYQLTDPLGVTVTLTSPFTDTELPSGRLQTWLFTAEDSVYAFLHHRARAAAAAVPAALTLTAAVTTIPADQIFELPVEVTVRRTGGVDNGELSATPAIRAATFRVPAAAISGRDGTRGLDAFAEAFEGAFAAAGLKVAAGVNRAEATAAAPSATIWAVRLNQQGKAISYNIYTNPYLYAPRPVANQLQSMQGVPVQNYTTEGGLAPPTRKLDFIDVDVDGWTRTLFAAIDDILSPAYTAGLQLIARHFGTTSQLTTILGQKQAFADAAATLMIPVYQGESGPVANVQEAFRQQLLTRLSDAYDVKAALQYAAKVWGDQYPTASSPRLLGAVRDDLAVGDQRSEISLSSPKLALAISSEAPLPILLTAPDAVHVDGAVAAAVDLHLGWRPSAIEHQIGAVPGVANYQASSWLSFVRPQQSLLDRDLGTVTVPLVLRAFPTAPALAEQDGRPTNPQAADLSAITEWTYEITWSLPFHYPQDRVHGEIAFNLPALATAVPDTAFAALADFITVYPAVRIDLDRYLAKITATTTDPYVYKYAGSAVTAFVTLVNAVLAAGLIAEPRVRAATDTTSYRFEVAEGVTADGALKITLTSLTPPGGAPAIVNIPGYTTVNHGSGVFTYTGPDGPLTMAEAQTIPPRSIVLASLDVLERQDARPALRIARNEKLTDNGKNLAAPFVYQTPEVRFSQPYAPTITAAAPVDIAALGTGSRQRTLSNQLWTLFTALLAGVPDSVTRLQIQAEVVYEYSLATGADPIVLPVFFQPPITLVQDPNDTDLSKLISSWTNVISGWRGANTPSTAAARLRFDLTFLSTLTVSAAPLLRLRNAELAIADII
ncbi:MAG TPA: hypothetical protein VGL63_06345 [Streptosporangiaceae bacterium]